MDEIASSNPGKPSKEVLREKALAAWRFTPSSNNSKEKNAPWNIVEASQRDMDFVVKALQRELNSGPRADHLVVNPNRNFTEQRENKNNSDEVLTKKLAGKKRDRESGKSPVTFVAADPVSFRAMVQQATGGTNSGRPATNLVKPQPKRPFLPSYNPNFSMPFSFPDAVRGFYSINDVPLSDGVGLYSPGLAAVNVGVPSPSVSYGKYLNGDGTSATPERFMDGAFMWNRSEFS